MSCLTHGAAFKVNWIWQNCGFAVYWREHPRGAPPVSEKSPEFDLDDPDLPDWIKDGALASGGFPYAKKLDNEEYLKELEALQIQLVRLQAHLQKSGERVLVLFEGRDAAGKGGAIKAYSEHLNPRLCYSVALPKPSDREQGQWYFQRYIDWFPAAGETALFDRSWYNRAGVEAVMGFCTPEQTTGFLEDVPRFEQMLVGDGIRFFKFWLSIGREMQLKRFHERRHDPLKEWKISPIDLKAIGHFDEYTAARDRMLAATDNATAPWTVVLANDKRRARLGILQHVLGTLDYDGKDAAAVGDADEKIVVGAKTFLGSEGKSSTRGRRSKN
jgi:polyphosphate kinase